MPEDTGRTSLTERKEDWPRSFLYMISWSVLKCILNYKKKKKKNSHQQTNRQIKDEEEEEVPAKK